MHSKRPSPQFLIERRISKGSSLNQDFVQLGLNKFIFYSRKERVGSIQSDWLTSTSFVALITS